jgi:four helix bundle protein
MPVDESDSSSQIDRQFDLEERTAKCGEAAIRFARLIPRAPVTSRIISQLVGSATSVGANYLEATEAESKKDFRHKIAICRKEAKETKHWLRMMAIAHPESRDAAAELWRETKELHLIFAKIVRTCDRQKSSAQQPTASQT